MRLKTVTAHERVEACVAATADIERLSAVRAGKERQGPEVLGKATAQRMKSLSSWRTLRQGPRQASPAGPEFLTLRSGSLSLR